MDFGRYAALTMQAILGSSAIIPDPSTRVTPEEKVGSWAVSAGTSASKRAARAISGSVAIVEPATARPQLRQSIRTPASRTCLLRTRLDL